MTSRTHFLKCLKLGQIYEAKAEAKIEGKTIIKADDSNYKKYKFDFQKEDGLKYEIKFDDASKLTNNCFIEFTDMKGRDSGLNITEANFYIIICGKDEEFLKIESDVLKILCEKAHIRHAKDSSRGYIIPIRILKKYSTII